jgi:deoxyribonuclease V
VQVYGWPGTAEELVAAQVRLAEERPAPWRPPDGPLAVGACFVCFPRGHAGAGAAGDPAWAAAVVLRGRRVLARSVVSGAAEAGYAAGLLALREGPLLDAAVRGLNQPPDVLLVNATGRDHPRRAGLALHLGAVLDLPTVGVTHRPLLAAGPEPPDEPGAASPLHLPEDAEDADDADEDGEVVAHWVRTRAGRRPLVVHAGWRVDPATAVTVIRRCAGGHRTPAALREARRLARLARAGGADRAVRPARTVSTTGSEERPSRTRDEGDEGRGEDG